MVPEYLIIVNLGFVTFFIGKQTQKQYHSQHHSQSLNKLVLQYMDDWIFIKLKFLRKSKYHYIREPSDVFLDYFHA